MKTIRILILALGLSLCAGPVLVLTSCATSSQPVAVNTLKAVGLTAKAAMDASTQLLKQGSITVPQWQAVAAVYDTRFQPAYNVAVTAVQSDLSSVASPDLVNLAAQLTNLVASYTTHP
jgi:hypothetical protein